MKKEYLVGLGILIVIFLVVFLNRGDKKEHFLPLGKKARFWKSYTDCTNLCDSLYWQGFKGTAAWCTRGCEERVDELVRNQGEDKVWKERPDHTLHAGYSGNTNASYGKGFTTGGSIESFVPFNENDIDLNHNYQTSFYEKFAYGKRGNKKRHHRRGRKEKFCLCDGKGGGCGGTACGCGASRCEKCRENYRGTLEVPYDFQPGYNPWEYTNFTSNNLEDIERHYAIL